SADFGRFGDVEVRTRRVGSTLGSNTPPRRSGGSRVWRRHAFMNESEDVVARLTRQLDRVAALREAAVDDPKLDAARLRLRAWQAVRLARTHADLLANPRMGLAATFFL